MDVNLDYFITSNQYGEMLKTDYSDLILTIKDYNARGLNVIVRHNTDNKIFNLTIDSKTNKIIENPIPMYIIPTNINIEY